ncbi:MAG: hypothetical protein HY586_07255 [Candidatus Omnitrophica bacterium]|nr:hypothetical protein [Candidatus Omnitrophota bacterium]
MDLDQSIRGWMRRKDALDFRDYYYALQILCYTTWALVPLGVITAGFVEETRMMFLGLSAAAVLVTILFLLPSFFWKPPKYASSLFWIYTALVTGMETFAIYFSGGVLSPACWLYFLTVSELIALLSPVRSLFVAATDALLLFGMLFLETTGALPHGGPDLSGAFFGLENRFAWLWILIGFGAILLSLLVYTLRRKAADSESANALLAEQADELKHQMDIAEHKHMATEMKNQELEKNRESIFKLMHHVEEVNKRLRIQGGELESRKDELESLNKRLLTKQEELIRSTEELEKANTELQKLDYMKSEFISTISHEIRTPLTSIQEGVSLITEKAFGPLNPQQEKFMNIIHGNVQRLSALIHDILDLSKLESGLMQFRKSSVDIKQLIYGVVESMKAFALRRRLILGTSFGQDLPLVYGDEQRIGQVLINLIGNAIKFTQEQGMIVASAHPVPGEELIQVTVVDTGKGIPKEEISEIFNKFYQISREIGGGPKGTGLGLPICQQIVQLHGGKIWAESEPGRGSKFTFTLPVFSVENYLQDLFRDMVVKSEQRGQKISFVLYKILDYPFLKKGTAPKQLEQLFSQFTDRILSKISGDARMVTDMENGQVLMLKSSDEEIAAALPEEGQAPYNTESFFLGNHVVSIKVHEGHAFYPEDGDTKEKLLAFLGMHNEMLAQFKP